MAFPQNPWMVWGYVPDLGINVTVTAENLTTEETITTQSAYDGSFLLDAANFTSGYNEYLGDIMRISAEEKYKDVVIDPVLYSSGLVVVLDQVLNQVTAHGRLILTNLSSKMPEMGDTGILIHGAIGIGKGGIG